MVVLITGVAGYIGSATASGFLEAGHKVIGIDNLSGKNKKAIKNIKKYYEVDFYEVDISNSEALEDVMSRFKIDMIFHFAATSNENFSKKDNLTFYENNIINLFKLLKAMKKFKVKTLIYPSSIFANVGLENTCDAYVKTKILAENMIQDYARSNPDFSYAILRYCNIAGYYSKIFLGEFEHYSIIKNITRIACGKSELGRDFNYDENYHFAHIDDIVNINLKVASELYTTKENICTTIASKESISVENLIKLVEKLSKKEIDITIALKNDHCDKIKSCNLLKYELEYSIEDICKNQLEHEARF
ncbi:SDR family NAD(P)-dependent oxidoreductase [Campylobacter sp. RM12637]|uniref:SDR family NAD(P)-dependent oxidoreductase n=1 Tax=Campylobacter sp. RM12637 TaxID=2735734 RepID=UPI003014EF3B|nr:SDR family NAD(P)-dependent oxidoreductase [Campylobacter sp. RM12637]